MPFLTISTTRCYLHRVVALFWRTLVLFVFFPTNIFCQDSVSRNLSLYIQNNSSFSVDIYQGSYGGKRLVQLSPFETKQVNFNSFVKDNEEIIFYYYYDLVYETLYVDQIASRDQYFVIKPQTIINHIEIDPPKTIETDNVYFLMHNNSSDALSITYGNSLITFKQSQKYIGISIPTRSSASFFKRKTAIGDFKIYDTQLLFPNIDFKKSWVYTFNYDGNSLDLTDARPLNKIGEPTWSVEHSNLNQPIALLDSQSSPIVYAASSVGRMTLYTVSDTGVPINSETKLVNGNLNIKSINPTIDEKYLLAGFINKNCYTPFLQLQTASGSVLWTIPHSKRVDCENGYILAVTGNETTGWLAVGGGNSYSDFETYYPYVCAIRGDSKTGTVLWELGKKDFGSSFGHLRAAAYDESRKIWVVAGDCLAETSGFGEPETVASYFATISDTGKIIRLESPIKNIIVNRILSTADGFYLVGEERKAGEGYGIVLKYGLDGDLAWKQTDQPKAYSYYQDAVLDEANDMLILAGTIDARNEYGEGGKPYLQSISLSTGKGIWSETYENAFSGASAIQGITRAPGYGYLLSLSRITNGGNPDAPYILAHVNECGKLINHEKRNEK